MLPIASISSMNTMEGDKSSATRNNSLTEFNRKRNKKRKSEYMAEGSRGKH